MIILIFISYTYQKGCVKVKKYSRCIQKNEKLFLVKSDIYFLSEKRPLLIWGLKILHEKKKNAEEIFCT